MYLALFRMNFATITMPPNVFPSHSKSLRHCLIAADIAITRFIVDVKLLVRAGVEADTSAALSSEDGALKAAAERRLDQLSIWLESPEPLGYGEDTYVPLLRAINQPNAATRLPLGNAQSMSTIELASLLYSMGKQVSPQIVQAPIYSKGSFLPVLKVAIIYISQRALASGRDDPEMYITRVLAMILDNHKVHHIPWSPPPLPNARPGRQVRKPLFNWWRSTSKSLETGHTAAMQVLQMDETEDLLLRNVAVSAQRNDVTAAWTMSDHSIDGIHMYLAKQILPDDFKIANASLSHTES
jgi:hypothetical protein